MEKTMRLLSSAWKSFFQTASFLRTLLETGVLGVILTAFVLLVYGPVAESLFGLALLFIINPICALYYALRLQPAYGHRLKQVSLELLRLTVTALAFNLISLWERLWS